MNARNKQSHVQAVEQIKKISDVINNPGFDKVNTLLKALGYVQREYKKPYVSKIKMYPNINTQYLDRMLTAVKFDVKKFINDLPSIDNPRQYVKKISITNDPYLVITNFMKSNMISSTAMEQDVLDYWLDIFSQDTDKNLDNMKSLLESLTGRSSKIIVKDAAKYIGIICVVCGTVLMNYIICMIGLGLIAVDMTIDQYIKESAGDSVLEIKDYPYIISGSYPLVHVDRELEFREIINQDDFSFDANNLVELIRNIGRYIDCNTINAISAGKFPENDHSIDHSIFDQIRDVVPTNCTLEEPDLYRAKQKIINISEQVIDYDFHIDNPIKRLTWCYLFLDTIRCGVNAFVFHNPVVKPIDLGSIVQMFEILCLQVWDAFLRHNEVKKMIPQENLYISMNITDDSNGIIQYYNALPPLTSVRFTSNSQTIVNNMLESVGSKKTILTEAAEEPADKKIDQVAAGFKKNVDTATNFLNQIKTKAIPWIDRNADKIKTLGNNIYNEDKVTMKKFSFNPANVTKTLELLDDINNALTVNYADRRQKGMSNLNDVITKHFPQMGNLDQSKPIPVAKVVNMITTGTADGVAADVELSGNQLKSTYDAAVGYITSEPVKNFVNSDIVTKLGTSVAGFKNKATQVAKQPMKESADDIFAMMEENSNIIGAPVIEQPKTSQPTNPNQPAINTASSVKTNVQPTNDALSIQHATDLAVGIIGAISSMTNDAYSLLSGLYQVLNSRTNQTPNQ